MKYKHLALEQRYEIKAYLKYGKTQKFITEQLGISKSTISKKLKRNRLKRGGYNPQNTQKQANIRKERFAVNRKFTPKNDFCGRENSSRTVVAAANRWVL